MSQPRAPMPPSPPIMVDTTELVNPNNGRQFVRTSDVERFLSEGFRHLTAEEKADSGEASSTVRVGKPAPAEQFEQSETTTKTETTTKSESGYNWAAHSFAELKQFMAQYGLPLPQAPTKVALVTILSATPARPDQE